MWDEIPMLGVRRRKWEALSEIRRNIPRAAVSAFGATMDTSKLATGLGVPSLPEA